MRKNDCDIAWNEIVVFLGVTNTTTNRSHKYELQER
jgi:hypothetical protein